MKSFVSALAILAVATPALAQNASLDPLMGTANLSAGFEPDPHSIQVLAGGDIDASTTGGQGCVGLISDAPDYRVNYQAGSFPLIFSAVSGGDTSLVINGPDGSWSCNDDSDALNPAVSFQSPQSGQYDIWVGAVGTSDVIPTTLSVSEVGAGSSDGNSQIGSGGNASGFDTSGEPTYGTLNLSAGFEPDPQMVEVRSGGTLDTSVLGNGCIGWASPTPDVRVNYEAGSYPLTFMAVSEFGDIGLAINLPDGTWLCDDDSAGDLDPAITLRSPASGQYDVYVTSVSNQPENFDSVLAVSEIVE